MINFEKALAESALLNKAFRHRSSSADHNETLEFLGDAVLDLAIADLLMQKHPRLEEGELTRWRASLVNEQSLYEQALRLEFERFLQVGDVDKKQVDAFYKRALSSCFEAVLGAIFVERGYGFCRQWIEVCFGLKLEKLPKADFHFSDHKTRYQEWAQEKLKLTPTYRLVETEAEGKPHFVAQVLLGDTVRAEGEGSSKKQAEQNAARKALEMELNKSSKEKEVEL